MIEVRPTPLATALVGSYVLSKNNSGTALGGKGASVGSLNFQPGRNDRYVVTGNLDYNGKLGTYQHLPFTGTYSLDNTGRGRIMLQSSAGTQNFNLIVNPQEYAGYQYISQASLSEVDGPQIAGTGQMFRRLNNPPTITTEPPTDARINFSGQIDPAAGSLPAALTGRLASFASVVADEIFGSFIRQGATLSFTPGDNLGRPNRVVFSLTDPTLLAFPCSYVAYALNPISCYAISLDPITSTMLLSGTITVPTSALGTLKSSCSLSVGRLLVRLALLALKADRTAKKLHHAAHNAAREAAYKTYDQG